MARARRSAAPRKTRTLFELPPLELECMKALWAQGEATVREIREQLVAGGRSLAYTTVETIMDRLARKGAVARRKAGRAHRYTPVYQAAEARAQAVRTMAEHFFGGDRRALASYLSGSPAEALAKAGVRAPEHAFPRAPRSATKSEPPPRPRRVAVAPSTPTKPAPVSTERRLDTSLL